MRPQQQKKCLNFSGMRKRRVGIEEENNRRGNKNGGRKMPWLRPEGGR